MEKVLSPDNMRNAWKQVKANKGAAGVDGMSIIEFPEFARNHWNNIRKHLIEGSYKPSPVKRVEIPKPDGGKRPLGIPTVTDRVIQQSIAQMLTPVFDPVFSESSFREFLSFLIRWVYRYFVFVFLEELNELIIVVGWVKPVLSLSRGEACPTKKGIDGFAWLRLSCKTNSTAA